MKGVVIRDSQFLPRNETFTHVKTDRALAERVPFDSPSFRHGGIYSKSSKSLKGDVGVMDSVVFHAI
jgi:hypothetical protein